jgi:hypothetical protein
MSKYGKKAGEYVEKAIRRMKKGLLRSGKNDRKVTDRKQAIAIGLAEAREHGISIPKQKKLLLN